MSSFNFQHLYFSVSFFFSHDISVNVITNFWCNSISISQNADYILLCNIKYKKGQADRGQKKKQVIGLCFDMG